MTDAELIAAVRRKCGKLGNTKELEDTDITPEGAKILRKIAEWITIRVHRYITSEADVREYDTHANTIRVPKVFRWDEASDQNTLVLGGYKVSEVDASEAYNFPSMKIIERMRRVAGLPRIRHEFDPINKKLKIDPMPTEAGDKYWYTSVERADWTMANLPGEFEELLVLGTSWKCLEVVALKRSGLGGVIREGGFVTYPATELKRFSDQYRDDFHAELKLKSKLYSRRP